ncbi:putative PAP-specific phosphatase, mitochondrial isoform X2 [Salvia miltiorrhiza]|uniref:putative PAP-specific phosphatase, mitochondrial isoform X2 n=1 Tax=Salvia miltiorrhiza TaxID=226208 RepID=UPI0025AC1DD7|nr:putative PAP-specific phosphatase, mitochondrial isoform X2 [Salvia miltiorrhiza]
MDVLIHSAASRFSLRLHRRASLRQCALSVRSQLSLPFAEQKAKYYRHLQAAVDVVERACHLCVDVQKSLFSSDGNIIEKIDQTPVTVADFGVQALVSLEMSKLFPSIPLVAEEDSGFVRENNLAGAVFAEVTEKSSISDKELSEDDVLKAIDRGGKDAYVFGPEPTTYWILDPIDGTRGFVKGSEALYVVGLALVVEGKIVLGVMGCPNWQERDSDISNTDGAEENVSRSGIIMISHVGCGTWSTRLWDWPNSNIKMACKWISLCKYLMVASGRASTFIMRARTKRIIKVWDHAVGVICIHEAGGKVTDWKGNALDFAADEKERRVLFPCGGILVTNDGLHKRILEIISAS